MYNFPPNMFRMCPSATGPQHNVQMYAKINVCRPNMGSLKHFLIIW